MSKGSEFFALLSDVPQSSAQLQEASGETLKTVSNRLTVLKGKGLAKRTKTGWIRVGGAPAADTESAAPPPRQNGGAKRAP